MRKISVLLGVVFTLGTVITGCKKGCIDDNALNYDSDATVNNFSCVYPNTAVIAQVKVKFIPAEDPSGLEWDADGSPDQFIKIIDVSTGTHTDLYTGSVQNGVPSYWKPSISFGAKNKTIRFELYDEDIASNDLMGQVDVNFNDFIGYSEDVEKYPAAFEMTTSSGVGFVVDVNWVE